MPESSSTNWLARLLRLQPIHAAIVALAVAILCGFVMRDFGLSTDEAIYIKNDRHLADWFNDFSEVGFTANFSKIRLQEGWHYARDDSKNLPLVTIVSSISHLLTGAVEDVVPLYRWGNIVVFAITCGVVFYWLRTLYSPAAALVAVAALVGTPRLLANSCLISIDPLVGCFWVLASWALSRARDNWKWSVTFAVLAGIGATSKTTFWFAFPVWVFWGIAYRPKELKQAAICLATITPLAVLLFVPTWWANPIGGISDYIGLLAADGQKGWPIDAYYMGEVFQYSDAVLQMSPLPWHAVPLLSIITTPIWILLLVLVGFAHWLRRIKASEIVTLWVFSGVVLPTVVMLPITPAHDGVRLFRVAFFFAALIAAYGFEALSTRWLCGKEADNDPEKKRAFRSRREMIAVASLCVMAVATVFVNRPANLSYYNLLTGGFEGAMTRVRLSENSPVRQRPLYEMSYWWELFDNESLRKMQEQLPPNAKLWVFPEHLGFSFGQFRRWGLLRDDISTGGPDDSQYVLIYGRLGRITLPHMAPLGNYFFDAQPVWERRVHGVRVVALYRWR